MMTNAERDEDGFIKFFRKDLDMTNKEELREFLTKHYRYSTMNACNRSTSYANRVKLHGLPLTQAQRSTAYGLLDVDEVWMQIRELMDVFADAHNYEWQVGFNGRSSGYIVLYKGGKNPDGSVFTWPGQSVDDDPDYDFDGWELEDFQARAELVIEFDALCDAILTEFVYYIDNYDVVEETVMVPKKIKVLAEKGVKDA